MIFLINTLFIFLILHLITPNSHQLVAVLHLLTSVAPLWGLKKSQIWLVSTCRDPVDISNQEVGPGSPTWNQRLLQTSTFLWSAAADNLLRLECGTLCGSARWTWSHDAGLACLEPGWRSWRSFSAHCFTSFCLSKEQKDTMIVSVVSDKKIAHVSYCILSLTLDVYSLSAARLQKSSSHLEKLQCFPLFVSSVWQLVASHS